MSVPARLAPSVDRPPEGIVRAGVLFLLLCDAALLLLLPHAAEVAACCAAALLAVLLVSRLPRVIALIAVGHPLLDPLTGAFGSQAPVFFALRLLLLGAIIWMVLSAIERPGSLVSSFASDPIVLLAVVLGLIVASGLLITTSPVYGRQKVVAYVATNLPLLAAGFLMSRRHEPEDDRPRDRRFESFLVLVAGISLLMAGIALLNALLQFYPYRSRLTILGLNPIWLARIMGIGVIAVLLLPDLGRIRPRGALLLAAPLVTVLLLTGSRGPFLSLLLILAIRVLVFARASLLRRAGLSIAGLAAGGLLLLVMPGDFRERLFHPMGVDTSGAVRLRFLEIARGALSHTFGWGTGTGGFSDLLGKGDFRLYPHNLTAEIGIENGLPGLLAFLGFVIVVFVRGLRWLRDPYARIAFLAFLYALVNAQFSGDLMANEWIWLFAGMIAGRTG